MKLQQLEYIIAIAHAGSITAAAKSLYQAQPNISIALKELESEIGMQIFWRTPNGMVLTPEGESFLLRAKDIVESMHSLESDYTNRGDEGISLKISTVRSAYLSAAIGQWLNEMGNEEKFAIHFIETNSNKVIENINTGKSDIGIIRMPVSQREVYMEQMKNRKIISKVLMEYIMVPLMRDDHPLADKDEITFEELKPYPEIVHADDEMNVFDRNYINSSYENSDADRRIFVHDNGSKMILLNSLHGAYMWASPGPPVMSFGSKFIIKKCYGANIKTMDMMICKKSLENNRAVKACMDYLTEFVDNMMRINAERKDIIDK